MLLRLARDAWRLGATILRVRPHVVQLNPSLNRAAIREILYMALIVAMHGGAIVIFNHGWSTRWPSRIARSRFLAALARTVCERADRFYVLSAQARREVLAWGVGADKVRSISMLCDTAAFASVRRTLPQPPPNGALQVLFLSRLVPGKGARELIVGFASVLPLFPRARLVIAGEGPERDELEALAGSQATHKAIEFAGYVTGVDKAQLLVNSDLFVFPSHLAEGFPVSLLEAMAAGLPVLASSVGGIVDLFANGARGEALSPHPTSQEIAAALTRWLAKPDRLREAGNNNRQLAIDKYDAPHWCSQLEADYRSLLCR
jgi:glycosyltransferase involved in cell wall biosynthesis